MTNHDSGDRYKRAVLSAGREAVEAEGNAVLCVAQQLDETFVETIDLVERTTGKVITVGAGTSGTVARRTAHLLSVSGTPSVFIHPMDALHGTMGAVEEEDLVFAFSKGGESSEINGLCQRLHDRGVKVVAITENPGSALGQIADIAVCLRTAEGGDPGGVLAMGSTLVSSVWCDALARVLMRKHHHTWNESLRLHPAGAVGLMKDAPEDLAPLSY